MTDLILRLPPEILAAVVDQLELRTTSFVGLTNKHLQTFIRRIRQATS